MTDHSNGVKALPLAQAFNVISNQSGLPVSLKTVYRWLAHEPANRPQSLRRLGNRLIVSPDDLLTWLESKAKDAYPQ